LPPDEADSIERYADFRLIMSSLEKLFGRAGMWPAFRYADAYMCRKLRRRIRARDRGGRVQPPRDSARRPIYLWAAMSCARNVLLLGVARAAVEHEGLLRKIAVAKS